MPIFFLIAGFVLLVSGVRGTTRDLYTLFVSDVTAFMAWFFLIVVIGLIGISKTIRPASNAFLVLIIITFFLKNGQAVATNITQTLKTGGTLPPSTVTTPAHDNQGLSGNGVSNYLNSTGGNDASGSSGSSGEAMQWAQIAAAYFA